jgi:prepilin signal peptidase PulO-like enzyme (type II secretory pathway)
MLAAKLRGAERPKYVPYGVAIATGTAVAFLWGHPLL